MKSFALLSCIVPLASAHWKITYPQQRQFDNEETMTQFPCGGINSVSTNRTMFPINGAPIQIVSEHTSYNIEVLLAIGNDPGSAFNTIVVPTFSEFGPNNICLGAGAIQWPKDLNITEGMNATLQIQTNGDGTGGLYNCADITFTNTMLSTADYNTNCQNSTGVTTKALQGSFTNANQTYDKSATASSSGSAASATSSKGAAPRNSASWGLAAAVIGAGAFAF
ncbi:hypothetical protein K461DRAFT_281909 [Myriangium duriaei CBS 260.36]|uniref:Copper acquisition factor BIM1-like domain-containing protein n=1 Tax=Myriangium duriaei CBS 260.36 TaxID=1168546 RepID=A0A9P4IVH2_9PEZI|nr:hypothetical protein K461DRAFT_281909 [Myriangium duriaei CBS 260.36]